MNLLILAQQSEASAIKPWLDLAVSYGIPLLVTILVIILLIRYVPKFIDGSIEAQRTIPAAISGLTDTLRDTRDTLREGVALIADVKEDSAAAREDLDLLKKALSHGATIGEKLMLEAGKARDSAVIIELGKIKELADARSQYEDRLGRRRKPRRPGDSEDA